MNACFLQTDANIHIQWLITEGEHVQPKQVLCKITGPARALLTAERCALNFLQTLSATATHTRRYVDAITGTQAQIFDTRKTLPHLRLAQKYAVTVGGGQNQRLALYLSLIHICNIWRASWSSSGLPSTLPTMATVVSAAKTACLRCAPDKFFKQATAFSWASRFTYASGNS